MAATPESTERLAAALRDLHEGVRACSRCYFIAEGELCAVCANPSRDQTVLCVVEEPLDVLAVERSGEFGGVYHVLGGALSPIDGVGPDQLTIDALERRLDGGEVREVVIATDPDVEGEATAHYLGDRLAPRGIPGLASPTACRRAPTSVRRRGHGGPGVRRAPRALAAAGIRRPSIIEPGAGTNIRITAGVVCQVWRINSKDGTGVRRVREWSDPTSESGTSAQGSAASQRLAQRQGKAVRRQNALSSS